MRLAFLIVLFWVIGGCADQGRFETEITLREIQRFGNEDFQASDSSALDRHFGAGILADVAGVVAGPDGTVYVLDRDWLKIASFSPSGEFLNLILGGGGEGPGEFRLPIHLSRGSDGHLSVLDYDLGRVTWFKEESPPQMVSLNRAGFWEHLVVGDTIFLSSSLRNPWISPFVTYISVAGDSIGVGPLLFEADRPYGTPRSMTRGADGAVLVTTLRPGVWMEYRGGRWIRRGTPLFPEASPPREDTVSATEIRHYPAQVSALGLASTPAGRVIQGYRRYPRPFTYDDPWSREEGQSFLAVFRPDGEHLGSIQLPGGVNSSCLTAGPQPGHVFLCSVDPFPQVIEYEIEVVGHDPE